MKKHDPLDPDKRYQVHNEQIEGVLKDIGARIRSQLPEGWVFNLVIASVGEAGSTFYISNMERDDSMDVLQELINKNRPASERYPEIKQAITLLRQWMELSGNVTSNPEIARLRARSQDYVENV